jgi:hypothetical protein
MQDYELEIKGLIDHTGTSEQYHSLVGSLISVFVCHLVTIQKVIHILLAKHEPVDNSREIIQQYLLKQCPRWMEK